MAKIDHVGIALRVMINCAIQIRKCCDKLVQNTGRKPISAFSGGDRYIIPVCTNRINYPGL